MNRCQRAARSWSAPVLSDPYTHLFAKTEEQQERGLQAAETCNRNKVAGSIVMLWNCGRFCSLKAALLRPGSTPDAFGRSTKRDISTVRTKMRIRISEDGRTPGWPLRFMVPRRERSSGNSLSTPPLGQERDSCHDGIGVAECGHVKNPCYENETNCLSCRPDAHGSCRAVC
jgi:hypothetical protein